MFAKSLNFAKRKAYTRAVRMDAPLKKRVAHILLLRFLLRFSFGLPLYRL